ncbi:metallophosphoesterase family protein [Aeromonas jandaei]|uniref:metallophosphoesterase family protein n=1 Tax=Aeromonas jandaei TaxID=650 RepID=UPI00398824B2
MISKKINILHISDVHFNSDDKNGSQNIITRALIDTIRKFNDDIDYCVFTGDLANQANPNEYKIATQWLDALHSAMNNRNVKFIIIPGNHDVDRKEVSKSAHEIRGAAVSEKYFNTFIDKGPSSRKHMSNFIEWHDRFKSERDWVISTWNNDVELVVDSSKYIDISFITFNSALLSCDSHDQGNLCINIKQLNECISRCMDTNSLRIGLIHHPLTKDNKNGWFKDWNNHKAYTALSNKYGCHFLLSGHVHDAEAHSYSNNQGQELTTFQCGSLYNDSEWKKEFSILEIDISKSIVKPRIYAYHDESGEWIERLEQSHGVHVNLSELTKEKSIENFSAYQYSDEKKALNVSDNVNFYDSTYENSELEKIKISQDIFINDNCDYNSNYKSYDVIIWLPKPQVISQIARTKNITGIVFCIDDIKTALSTIEKNLDIATGRTLTENPFKKIPDDIKQKVADLIKIFSKKGFMLSVSIPANLFDYSEDRKKVNTVYNALINSMLFKVFAELHSAGIPNINVKVMSQGEKNNGIDSRIAKLATKHLSSETIVNRSYIDIESELTLSLLNKILGLSCWFVDQSKTNSHSEWLNCIKGL